MDPVSAIGTASAILSFVQFSWELVAGAREIYKSADGNTDENARISKVISDLQDVTDSIEFDQLGTSKHEKALKRLASECFELGEELLFILKKLKWTDGNPKWSALRTKLNSMRKKDDIASIKERLADYRSQIVLRLNMMLVEQNSSLKTQLDGLQQAMLHHSTPRSEELKKLQEALESALAQSTLKNAQELDELHIGLQETGSSLMEQTITLEYIKNSLDSLRALVRIIPLEKRILEHIYYDSMFERQEAIHAAEEGTFKWLLIEEDLDEETISFGEDEASLSVEDEELEYQQQDEKARAKVKLLTWLRSGSGTFHISGKAGSGKSTLMKLIAGHEITRIELGLWAGDNRKLVRSNHYFWSTGDKMQKSYEGLYRSILYDVLTKCPSLIQKVFQEQWNSLVKDMSPTATGKIVIEQSLFRPPMFKKAFEDLINHQLDDNYCLCVTIDGLDEFEGDSCDYWDLAEYLAKWSKKPNIKCLLSSRPYKEFINTFPEDTRLRLHDINKADIYTFASQKLLSDRHFHRLRTFYKDLVRKIVRLSEGVFLWAVLVVRVLLSSAAFESKEMLFRKLDELPQELKKLYNKLLGPLTKLDKERVAKMFLLKLHDIKVKCESPFQLSVFALSCLDDLEDQSFPSAKTCRLSNEEYQQRVEMTEQRIYSLSRGLLETAQFVHPYIETSFVGFKYVRFLHRSVADYLNYPEASNAINLTSDFDVEEAYTRLRLAETATFDEETKLDHVKLYWQLIAHQTLAHQTSLASHRQLVKLPKLSRILPEPAIHTIEPLYRSCSEKPYEGPIQYTMSFIHWAAYQGYGEYVRSHLSEDCKAESSDSGLNLLFSALFPSSHYHELHWGPKLDVVLFLLSHGFHFKDYIRLFNMGHDIHFQQASIWILFVLKAVKLILGYLPHLNKTQPQRVTYGAREYMDAHLRILDIFLADGADADIIIRFDDHHDEKMLLALEDILDELRLSYSAKFQAVEAGDMPLGSGKVKRADLPLWARRIPGVGQQDRLTDVGYFLSSNGPGRKATPRCICSKDEYINLDPNCGIRKY